MALYSAGFVPGAVAINKPVLELRASGRPVKLREVELAGATNGQEVGVGLARTTSLGTLTSSTTPEKRDPGSPAASCAIATAWSADPVKASVYMRRVRVSGAGRHFGWSWREGLVVPDGASLVLWTLTAALDSAGTITIVVEE